MNKQEEREYWTKLLAENDGAVWCDVRTHRDSDSLQLERRLVIAYLGGDSPFASVAWAETEDVARAAYVAGRYSISAWSHATPILHKPRRPWTAEEIMLHGVFEHIDTGHCVRVEKTLSSGRVCYAYVGDEVKPSAESFCDVYRAVCLELRDGILCDTGKRIELYKDGE